jgi:hypothetical protein
MVEMLLRKSEVPLTPSEIRRRLPPASPALWKAIETWERL